MCSNTCCLAHSNYSEVSRYSSQCKFLRELGISNLLLSVDLDWELPPGVQTSSSLVMEGLPGVMDSSTPWSSLCAMCCGRPKKKWIRPSSCSQKSSQPGLRGYSSNHWTNIYVQMTQESLPWRWAESGLATVFPNILSAGLMRRSHVSADRMNMDAGQGP